MSEKRRYPGSMEGSALGSMGGANFNFDDDDEQSTRRRVPRTRRASLSSEYSQVEQEVGVGPTEDADELPIEPTLEIENLDEDGLLTDIPQATKQRIHQSLIQELGALELPAPRSTWEDAILERIEPQVHILIEAELRRMRASIEEQVSADTFQRYAKDIAEQIRPALEEQIRKSMWDEFEEMWRQREAAAEKSE